MPTEFIDEPEGEWKGKKREPCLDRGHNPPSHILVPRGKIMVHTCPACGKVTQVRPMTVTF